MRINHHIVFRSYWVLLLAVLFPLLSQGQDDVRFEASSDARQVVLNGYFTVSFTLHNANGSDFQAPPFKNFTVLSGPNTSTSMRIVNGQRSQSYALSYQLQPKKIGKFTIGPATIKAGGKTLRTKAVQVEVLKGRKSNASTQEELSAEISEQVFIRAVPNTEKGFIGEQIILDYKIYTTRDIETYNLISESDYPGFFAKDLRRYNGREVKEVIDGIQYSTKILKRVALFPQQAGLLEIDPMHLQLFVVAESQRGQRSLFSLPKMTPVQIQTQPLAIEILPLPDGAPSSFAGAVGNFSMRTTINRTDLSTDDAISLRMQIKGNGDLKQVQAPNLNLPAAFEVYDPKVLEEENFESGNELTGEKHFEYLLLPKKPGTYDLSFAFTYFDPDSLTYLTIRSDTTTVNVKKGTLSNTVKRSQVQASKESIRFIKTDTTLRSPGSSFFGTGIYWSLFALPFFFLGFIFFRKRRMQQLEGMDASLLKSRRAQKVAQKKLALSRQYLEAGKSKEFYDEVSRASFGYICDKLRIPLSELTKDNVREKLQFLQVSEDKIERFLTIVKTCEMALFAGKDNSEAMSATYQDTMAVIAEIEEEIGQ